LDITLILTILGIAVTVIAPVAGYIFKLRKEYKNYYSVIWKSSRRLKARELLGERPYDVYYFERKLDVMLLRVLERKRNVLIVGPPLSGKTRAVFNSLKKFKKKIDVLVPRAVFVPSFHFPKDFMFWREKLILIDDLQYYVEKQDNYHLLFRAAKERGIPIAAACHSGREFKKVKNKLAENNLDVDIIFGENIIELEKISVEEGKKVAKIMGMQWDSVKFNGTIGSIFMHLSEMERRFDNCTNVEKTILLSVRNLYKSGIYDDNSIFKIEWIKRTALHYELEGKDFEWAGWIKGLEDKEFLKLTRRDKVWAEDAYLEYIVKPQVEIPDTEIISEMINVFSSDAGTLMMIGERAYSVGILDIEIGDYMKTSIKAFTMALENLKPDEKMNIAKAYEYLGLCHWRLSIIEDVKENCVNALHYFEEALKNVDLNKDSLTYVRLQVEMGNAYTAFADIESRVENCKKAIDCYNESLKYFSPEKDPVQFASSHHNLGATYFTLSLEENTANNLKLAIESLQKAIEIRTFGQYPGEYALTSNNLGNCYANLSMEENKKENLKLSIEHFKNILKVHDKTKHPFKYATTITNLGNVYSMLAEIEDFDENVEKALRMLNESLEIRQPDKFPLQYAASQYSLGDVYLFVAQIQRNAEFCHKSIDALKECLTIRTLDKYPLQYALAQNLLGKAYSLLSELEDKSENYHRALHAFDEALKVYTPESNPLYYNVVQENISKAKKVFF
jgi:tetratricopeptide (TPR) repeat protein